MLNDRSLRRARRPAAGQAIIECLVVSMLFLVPLYFGVVALGTFADIRHQSLVASRYASWERTVWEDEDPVAGTTTLGARNWDRVNQGNAKTSDEIRSEIATRVINDRSPDRTLSANDRTANAYLYGIDPMWRDPGGTPLLAQYADLTLAGQMRNTTVSNGIGVAPGGFTDFTLQLSTQLPAVYGENLPLPYQSSHLGSFGLVAGQASPFYAALFGSAWTGVQFVDTTGLTGNTWMPNGAAAERQILVDAGGTGGIAPMSNLGLSGGLGAELRYVQYQLQPYDPTAMAGIDVGRIRIDDVPADRLK